MKIKKRKWRSKEKRLFDKAWALMSEYVRRRDKGICFTCGKKDLWQFQDAGHFKHNTLDFNLKNINCQCTACNRFWHGKLDVYATRLVSKYGPGILEELEREAVKPKKYTEGELKSIIAALKILIKGL